jgi:GT2 family glycosyltransferase
MITDFDNFIEPLNTTSVKKKYLTANEAFLRKDLVEVGLFSDEFPFFRADSELAYKILSRGGVIKYAPSVVAYHPLRRFRWSDLSATVKWSMFDPLLAKKHPEQVKADVLRQPLPGVTVEGLAFIFFIAVVVSSALLVSLIYALVTGASLISVAIVGLSEKRSSYRGKSSKLRLEGSVVSLLVYFCNELGRIAGSVKYRKFLI